MNYQKLITATVCLFLIMGINSTSEAQFGKKISSAVSKLKTGKKSSKKKQKGEGSFAHLNSETDELGVTGQYFSFTDKKSFGFKYVKEAEGKIVDELHYWEKKAEKAQLVLNMKANYYSKYEIKLFFKWTSASATSYVEIIEVDPGVFAQIKSDRSINSYDKPVPVDAKRTVVDVYAKDNASFDTWDIETAQAKVDMLVVKLKSANAEKVKKKLMGYDAYKKYAGKIAFAKSTSYLKNSRNEEPKEKVSNFITKRELGATTAYKPYFDKPIEQSHPGAWFNVTYEMAGFKTDREALRKTNAFFSKNIPQYDEEKNKYYFQYSKILVDPSNNRADYAFLELLRLAQGEFKAGDTYKYGDTYKLKLTVWAYKDGQNIEELATGTIEFEFTPGDSGSQKLIFDHETGWVSRIEKYLDE
jgi:hypothetical protein